MSKYITAALCAVMLTGGAVVSHASDLSREDAVDALLGYWEGWWNSSKVRARGRARLEVTLQETGEPELRFSFETGNPIYYDLSQGVEWNQEEGVFHTEGELTADLKFNKRQTRLKINYRSLSKGDFGTITLKRDEGEFMVFE